MTAESQLPLVAILAQLMGVDTGNATVEPWRPTLSGQGNYCKSIREESKLQGSLVHILKFPSQPRIPLQKQHKVCVILEVLLILVKFLNFSLDRALNTDKNIIDGVKSQC